MATRITTLLIAAMLLAGAQAQAIEVRIKDIARFQGYSDNQLVGYGLVFGLRGSGDGNQILFTAQAIANMLNAQGIKHERTNIRTRNTASVMVTATLPPFAKPGSKIDVSVSAIGDATSLQGGTLLMTPLRAPNGEVFATAQGPVIVGGFAAGGGAAGVTQNVPTAGNVPNGAIVQREVNTNFQARSSLTLVLDNYDFTTATRVASVVNEHFDSPIARSRDGASIDVIVPAGFRGKVIDFMAQVEKLTVETDERAVVIINEKTGTVVIGQQVRISTCAVAHGNLTIQISTAFGVSQPQPFSEGQTVVVPEQEVTVTEEMATGREDAVMMLPEGANIGEIVGALNALGVSPRDVISILQAIKAQGALKAELKVL
ncbi:MAG TPA: flagellar basal body P-ring protein FlgI [Acidobacteriota bacterium]|nr:flagellar basal body P-ring protein FlgI [Acidobacteriota bacterium]